MGRRLVKGNRLKTAFWTRNGPLEYQTMCLLILLSRLNKSLAEKLDILLMAFLSELHWGPCPAPWKCCFHQGQDRFLKISLSPSHYETCCTPYLNAKETTGLPEMSTAKRLGVDDGKVVGAGGSGGAPPHCWIRLDHLRCRFL